MHEYGYGIGHEVCLGVGHRTKISAEADPGRWLQDTVALRSGPRYRLPYPKCEID